MCGIVVYWAKESVLEKQQYYDLFKAAALRGSDGFNLAIFDAGGGGAWFGGSRTDMNRVNKFDKEHTAAAIDFAERRMKVGSVLMAHFRATPETERQTTFDMLQPIVFTRTDKNPLYLVHNGGVTDSIRGELKTACKTRIDSEMIMAMYEDCGRNMKTTMEKLSGSFAFAMLDTEKNVLYAVTSFNPLAHMYVRGYGYFLHSSNDALAETLYSLTGQKQDGVNVWESWYHHYIDGYTIIKTDLESGFQFKTQYRPRFLHPVWNSQKDGDRTKAIVVASGGVDSGLTAWILKKLGYDVELLHFMYGQKSEEAEWWAVQNLARELPCTVKLIDLRAIYQSLEDISMLTDKDLSIESGGDKIKSTIAWVAGRNAIFASMAMARAESLIVSGQADRVEISAGWYQLSEEVGGYPDNSFMFADVLERLKMFGYITGSRISFVPILQRLTKTEEWKLGQHLNFPFELTVSCDSPVMVEGKPHLCTECGSTKLSMIAADRAGINDNRLFVGKRERLSAEAEGLNIERIVDRLMLIDSQKKALLETTGSYAAQ